MKPIIILVEPQLAENIGMVARAMANFGLDELRLVAPRDGWPKKGAHSAASGASWLIEQAKLYPDVTSAIADLNMVYATTARARDLAKTVYTPEQIMPQLVHNHENHPLQKTGIMFGPERTGLSNEHIALSNALITFPVNPDFSSLNLAQSVLLVGYEWFRTLHGGVPLSFLDKPAPNLAKRNEVTSFFEYVESELAAVGFFPPQRQESMMHNLMDLFLRLDMSSQDIRTLRGVFSALVNGRRGGRNTPRPARQTLLSSRDHSESDHKDVEANK